MELVSVSWSGHTNVLLLIHILIEIHQMNIVTAFTCIAVASTSVQDDINIKNNNNSNATSNFGVDIIRMVRRKKRKENKRRIENN